MLVVMCGVLDMCDIYVVSCGYILTCLMSGYISLDMFVSSCDIYCALTCLSLLVLWIYIVP